jgi:hypothetical protein
MMLGAFTFWCAGRRGEGLRSQSLNDASPAMSSRVLNFCLLGSGQEVRQIGERSLPGMGMKSFSGEKTFGYWNRHHPSVSKAGESGKASSGAEVQRRHAAFASSLIRKLVSGGGEEGCPCRSL